MFNPYPFDASEQQILGQVREGMPGYCSPVSVGYSRSLLAWRRVRINFQFVQAAAGADFILAATTESNAINLTAAGEGDSATPMGYPASFGDLSLVETDLYEGGLACDPKMCFIVRGISARPTRVFSIPLASGAVTHGDWSRFYGKLAEEIARDSTYVMYKSKKETCKVYLPELAWYNTQNPSGGGDGGDNTNSVAIKNNVLPLKYAIVICAQDGESAAQDLRVVVPRAQTLLLNSMVEPPAADLEVPLGETLNVEFEIVLFGECSCIPMVCDPCGRTEVVVLPPVPVSAPAQHPG